MTELEVVQWLFDTEVFTKAFNWPVNADGNVGAARAGELTRDFRNAGGNA